MNPAIQVVEAYLERGDLKGCESWHSCRISVDETGILVTIKRSFAVTAHGEQEITGELTPSMEGQIIDQAMRQYEAEKFNPSYDWDRGDDDPQGAA